MRRRRLIQSMLAAPAAAVLPARIAAQESKPIEETPPLSLSTADAVADGVVRFFNREEMAALRKLGEILMPARGETPGASEAEAAAFLDFLLSQSAADRQSLYRDGLARLDRDSRTRHGKLFSELTAVEAAPLLAPLREPWTYNGPQDPFARFLRAAKEDFWRATLNSRAWATAQSSRSRGAAGVGLYWLPID